MAKVKKSAKPKPEERRKYPRVELSAKKSRAPNLLDIRCFWPWGETTELFDISFQGAAIQRPREKNLKMDEHHELVFFWPSGEKMQVRGKLMWINDKVVGLHFPTLMPKDRIILDDFLGEQIKGLNLRSVDTKHLSASVDCDIWYQGQSEINVFIWMGEQPQSLDRIRIEIEDDAVDFTAGRIDIQLGGTDVRVKKLIDEDLEPTDAGFESESLREAAEKKILVRRVILLISHLPNETLPLKPVLRELTQHV